MSFIEEIYARAKANRKLVAVPECTNPSMMRSAVRAAADGLADIVFVGERDRSLRGQSGGYQRYGVSGTADREIFRTAAQGIQP